MASASVGEEMSMKEKTVYVNQWQGNDTNDGLTEDTPILTKKRATEIQRKEKTQALKIVARRISRGDSLATLLNHPAFCLAL